jgi:hypothetical protein
VTLVGPIAYFTRALKTYLQKKVSSPRLPYEVYGQAKKLNLPLRTIEMNQQIPRLGKH